jgi:hypothetical protein
MDRTNGGGPDHKIKTRGAQHCLACTARLLEDILKIEIDLLEYARYCILYNDYHVTE